MNNKLLASKLSQIQEELKVPKNNYNKFGEFYYRSAEDILVAVKPLLAKHGLTLTLDDSIIEVGGRVYVYATAYITDGENLISTSAGAREAVAKTKMDDAQITGSASSYARKYALNGMFLLDDVKDADTQDNSNNSKDKATKEVAEEVFNEPAQVITEDQKGRIQGKVKDLGITKKAMEARLSELFKTKELDRLTFRQAAELETMLNQKLEEKEAKVSA